MWIALAVLLVLTTLWIALILPARPYQALAELDPPGFRRMRKYVPLPGGGARAYR